MSPVWILKHLVSVFVNSCCLLSALPSLSQFGQGRLSLVAISFYALLLLFEPCPLSEFTLAGSLYNLQLLLVIHMWLVKPWTTILTSTPKGYHRSQRGASMNIKSYLLLYQIGQRSWLTILFFDVSSNNTVNSLQKLSLQYKELLF